MIRLKDRLAGSRAPEAQFLRDAFDSACLWFPVALAPDYNALHADHFHLQGDTDGVCAVDGRRGEAQVFPLSSWSQWLSCRQHRLGLNR